MYNSTEFTAINDLDLDMIKRKLTHAESGEGWSPEQADAVELEYKRFLFLLKKFPDDQIAPTENVDLFWHYHILDTMKYASDCDHVFGYFLHHYPYLGMRSDGDEETLALASKRMNDLYRMTFDGTRTGHAAGATSAWCVKAPAEAKSAWCVKAPAEAKSAWCVKAPAEAKSAWCVKAPAAVKSAWCVKGAVTPQAMQEPLRTVQQLAA